MGTGQMLHLLVIVCAFVGFHKSNAQIFIGDNDSPGILWAPLPDRKDDTNPLDMSFTLISLPSRTTIDDIGYDPTETMVYWCSFNANKISRIQLDGTNQEDIISTNSPSEIALDLTNGKIYWGNYNDRTIAWANLDGTLVDVLYVYSSFVQPISILVNPVNGYLLWSSRIRNELIKADLSGSNQETVKDIDAQAMTEEQCADGTSRVFYYTSGNTLGVVSLNGSEYKTLAVLQNGGFGLSMAKYGAKLFWTVTGGPLYSQLIYEYDMMSSTLRTPNRTVKMVDGSYLTVDPASIEIFSDGANDDRVAIEGCPESFVINLEEDATSTPVSWAEPKLNYWSSCPSMEFSGNNVTNGGNVSKGVFEISYLATDSAGNTDSCQFTVTVLGFGEVLVVPPAMTTPAAGSGTTIFAFSTIIQTFITVVLFYIALR